MQVLMAEILSYTSEGIGGLKNPLHGYCKRGAGIIENPNNFITLQLM
jgi:hypothetical protein